MCLLSLTLSYQHAIAEEKVLLPPHTHKHASHLSKFLLHIAEVPSLDSLLKVGIKIVKDVLVGSEIPEEHSSHCRYQVHLRGTDEIDKFT